MESSQHKQQKVILFVVQGVCLFLLLVAKTLAKTGCYQQATKATIYYKYEVSLFN
jgi:hypothetical protein